MAIVKQTLDDRLLRDGAKLTTAIEYSNDPAHPSIKVILRPEGVNIAGLRQMLEAYFPRTDDNSIKFSEKSGEVVLEDDGISHRYNPSIDGSALGIDHYYLYHGIERPLREIQSTVSTRSFMLPLQGQNEQLHVETCTAPGNFGMTDVRVFIHTRQLQDDMAAKSAGQWTDGSSTDFDRKKAAYAVLAQLVPGLIGQVDIYKFEMTNISNNVGMELLIEPSTGTQQVLDSMDTQLQSMEQHGIPGQQAIPVAKPVDEDAIKMDMASILAQAMPGDEYKARRQELLKKLADAAMGRTGQSPY